MLADYFQSYGLRIVGEADVRMLFGSLRFNVVSIQAIHTRQASHSRAARQKRQTPNTAPDERSTRIFGKQIRVKLPPAH
jgi:hypothetical protein